MRFRLIAVAAALVAAVAPARLVAENGTEYLALLDRYVGGDWTGAAKVLAAWPEDQVRTAVRACCADPGRSTLPPARLRTAAMLHTESAFAEVDEGQESFQLEVARSFVRRLLDFSLEDPEVYDFAARWHAFAAVMYCTRNQPGRAAREVNRGLGIDRSHKQLNLVAGALLEYRIGQDEPNLRGTWNIGPDDNYAFRKLLQQAALTYRGIVAANPEFFEARLRLGWVLALNDSPDSAREHLEAVIARARRPELSYLAHLFLGSLHERARRPADAAREYEAARAVSPFQSSLMALLRIAAAHGDDDRRRSLANEISAKPADEDDPWSFYSMCVTSGDLFEGLRAEAQRR